MAKTPRLRTLPPRICALPSRIQPARGTPRLVGRPWRTLRAEVLASDPLCTACAAVGRTTIATEVDHITALHRGGSNGRENLQPLCSPCHRAKTDRELRGP
jgi:5-methylcytosine-specific restriction protein A